MNILFISHEYPPIGGGGANACYYLGQELTRRGHSVTVVTAAYAEECGTRMDGGVRLYREKAMRSRRDSSSFIEMFSFLVRGLIRSDKLCKQLKLSGEKFDKCVVFFGIPSGPIGLYLKYRYKLPYVIRFGGGDIPGTQKRFGLMYKLLSPIIRIIWREADALIANSEGLKERALLYEDRYKISVICNGVDTNRFRRTKPYVAGGDIKLLFVSRLLERKGLQYVIPHLKEIENKVGRKVKLTVVGDGPYRDELERLARENGTEQVDFAGFQEGENLIRYYEDATIFILPSMWEGMPNVVLEAMSMGLPIAMTNCEGSQELVNGNGVVSSIGYFVDWLISMCIDTEKLYTYSVISRQLAETRFSWDNVAREYEKN